MYLKRVYERQEGGEPKLSHVKVLNAGPKQRFSTKFIEQQGVTGLVSVSGGKIIIKTAPGEGGLVYRIIRGPGMYCCHCDAPQPDPIAAQAHLAGSHPGAESPDRNNPAGYRRDHFYECEKEA